MKKTTIIIMLSIVVCQLIYPQKSPVKIELGALYSYTFYKPHITGFGFYVHPTLYLNKQIYFGIKAEVIEAGKKNDEKEIIHVSALHSYLFTSRYYFSTASIRYYVELGLGIYNMKSMVYKTGENSGDFEFKFKRGFAPKFGIDLGPVTMNIAYNYIYDPMSSMPRIDYVSVGLGGFFKTKYKRKKSRYNYNKR